jgi:hypothetical protein
MAEPIRQVWTDDIHEIWQWADDSTARGENTGTARFVYRVHINGRPLAWIFDTLDKAIASVGLAVEIT